jgi:deazaflavin-dependent oxidoreductase (nitroreductase family)
VVVRSASRRDVAAVTASTALSNASWFAREGFVVPLILRTYWSAASWTSSWVAGGAKLWSVRMFRHMPTAYAPGVSTSYTEAAALHRFIRRIAATRPGAWFFARTLDHIDRPVYRWSGGRTTLAAMLSGLPVVMLTTSGARSGRRTTSPVLGFEEGDVVIVIGSNYGQAHHPAWVHNLRADPRAQLEIRGVAREVTAEEAAGPERERYLDVASAVYPGYRAYVKRAAPRRIAVIRLIPSRGI